MFVINQTLAVPDGLADGSHRGLGPQVLQQGRGGEDQGRRWCLHPHCSVDYNPSRSLWSTLNIFPIDLILGSILSLFQREDRDVDPRQELATSFCNSGHHDGGGGG